jgi:polyisoprenoid-binding protein YceI
MSDNRGTTSMERTTDAPASIATPGYRAGTWKADPVHSEITMNYRSTGIRRTGDGWVIDGELTSHGVTRQVLQK